jgi:UDP-hydrolysing UDP-N-acetyl-D-glucosamine 2-epimerase
MTRILSVSSSRADVAILTPVWAALAQESDVELHVLVTGMHLAAGAVEVAVPAGAIRHVVGADIGGADEMQASDGMAACLQAAGKLLARIEFDCMLLMGDRLDMFPAACAALPFNLPLAHLHGGELTYGAIDDRIRHAISKMAHIHFASSADAAARLVGMGEEPWRIHVTGGPGLDNLRQAPVMQRDDFMAALHLPFDSEFILATVHPETNAADPAAPMQATLAALDALKKPVLITAPNSDPGGRILQAMIDAFLPGRRWAAFRASLGAALYPSALRHAAVMVGNSSSGLIEAGYLGLPVVNVGLRQDGRPAGDNVVAVDSTVTAIQAALEWALAGGRRRSFSPYGDGYASQRIVKLLTDLPPRDKLLYKRFHSAGDMSFFTVPWDNPGENVVASEGAKQ